MADKGYNSESVLAPALVFALGVAGSVYMQVISNVGKLDQTTPSARQSYRDLNNNGIPERFYTIDKKIALIEADGKPVLELLKK